uniref:Uncharacterized protein n=1 Tax=Quercus lobata TaxID=97700 RepID=A0A7N2R437_QUELO
MLYENNNSRSRSTINDESPPPNPQHKIALIIGIASQDGSYLTEFLSTNGFLSWFWICKMCWWLYIGGSNRDRVDVHSYHLDIVSTVASRKRLVSTTIVISYNLQ